MIKKPMKTSRFSHLKSLLALNAAAAISIGGAQAVTVAWGSVGTITDETDIVNAGSVVDARNYTDQAGNLAVTVGADTVTFIPTGTLTGGAGPVFNTGAFDTTETGVTIADGSNFDKVLDGFAFRNDPGWDGHTVDYTGLTLGGIYTIQVFLTDDRGGGVNKPINMTIGGVTSANLMTANDASHFVVGTVTLGAAEDSFSMALNSVPDNNAVLNAVVLAQVPEPSSVGFLGLAAGMVMLRRKRR